MQNAGTNENPQVYLGEGKKYGDFTDPYLVKNGFENPHKLHFTETNNPDPKPIQAISVTFEGVGRSNIYTDPATGGVIPAKRGLTDPEADERKVKIAALASVSGWEA